MKAKILSFNVGHPAPLEWNGKSVTSSMKKHAVPGPLKVHVDRIEGNSFANAQFHGAIHSVLYAYGLRSAQAFADLLGKTYEPGMTGETITVDDLPEEEISVGDVFRFGEVVAQVTYPRIPCGKVNFRMEHPEGQRAMQRCGKSGVYFRILQPGIIHLDDRVERTEKSKVTFPLVELYRKVVNGEEFTRQEMEAGLATGVLPEKMAEKFRAALV